MKSVIKIGHTRIVLDTEDALEFIKFLWSKNLEVLDRSYNKIPDTTSYETVYHIKPMRSEDCHLEYMSPANYLLYTANGDKE